MPDQMKKMLQLIPALHASGYLDRSGGAVALRDERGFLVSPENAGELMKWELKEEDLVLFPGEGEASMARAGRRPNRMNRWLREMLAVRPEWRCCVQTMGWGAMSFALAGRELPLHNVSLQIFSAGRNASVPLVPADLDADAQAARLREVVGRTFGRSSFGAVLVEGEAVVIAGTDGSLLPAALDSIEGLARAQQWLLMQPHER
ncbi:MAG: hypothetical protein R3F46_11650 [bacterium]